MTDPVHVAICENSQIDDKLRYKYVILLKTNECGKEQRKHLDVQYIALTCQ